MPFFLYCCSPGESSIHLCAWLTSQRAAESTTEPASKKTKPKSSTAKPAPTSTAKPKKADKEDKDKVAKEKEAEAPASAKPDTSKGILKVGDKLPKLVLKDNGGDDVDIGTLADEKGVVLFLYPKVGPGRLKAGTS
jgi:peroxiredoxin Q/BCP